MDEFDARVGSLSEKKRALLELLLKEAGDKRRAEAGSPLLSPGGIGSATTDAGPSPSPPGRADDPTWNVAGEDKGRRRTPLVPLRATGSRPPFFCVHAAGGSVFTYLSLVPRLTQDQPIYGLEAAGLDGEEPPLDRVELMADRYLESLRVVRSEGPFLLGGWSLGGAVAFEMASRLLWEGEDVALLALIDVSVPDPSDPPGETEILESFVYDLASLNGRPPPPLDRRVSEMDPEARVAHVLEELRRAELVPPAVDEAFIQNRLDVFRANVMASYAYAPNPYRGRITLIRARESPDTTRGWSYLALGGIEDNVVPGDHYTVWAEPNLSALVGALQASIDRALAADEAPRETRA